MNKITVNEHIVDAIALLLIPGIGRNRYRKLVKKFGSPGAVLAATKADLEAVPQISYKVASRIKTEYAGEKARSIAARIYQLGWTVLYEGHREYPALLAEIADPPALLFRLGDYIRPDEKCLAIVGTRKATEKGRLFAHRLARELSQASIVVVSGMAEGIDSAAHLGALENNGKTIAVWGTSLDIVYPAINRELAKRILRQGCIFSEYFPDTHPEAGTFPERNRIITGLASGVVVVEAGKKSGALISAEFALEQGRELFAMPGHPGQKKSEGTNSLIKKGANLITSVEDVFTQLPLLKGEIAARKFSRQPDITAIERELISHLSAGPQQIDKLAHLVKLTVSEVLEFLLALEMKGIVQEISGKRFILSE